MIILSIDERNIWIRIKNNGILFIWIFFIQRNDLPPVVNKDKEGSNPFYNGDVLNYNKKNSDKKETTEYLFINVA